MGQKLMTAKSKLGKIKSETKLYISPGLSFSFSLSDSTRFKTFSVIDFIIPSGSGVSDRAKGGFKKNERSKIILKSLFID
mgnify:CR=1 FL=1